MVAADTYNGEVGVGGEERCVQALLRPLHLLARGQAPVLLSGLSFRICEQRVGLAG